ncbi:MAG: helix-turn-helix domain-containing protein [Methanobacterium sp.]
MAFIEIKTIKGKQYKYRRKSVRKGDKVIHVNVEYLGPVEPVYKTGKSEKTRKSNASIFVRDLTEEEYEILKKLTKSSDSFKHDRAKILLLSSEKEPTKQISEKTNCDIRKVRNAIRSFNEKGIVALERGKAKGASIKFTDEEKAKMLKAASTEPIKLGLHFTTWSLSKLRNYYLNESIVKSISIESVRRLMKSEGMKIKKSKRFQYSNDKEFDKKNS